MWFRCYQIPRRGGREYMGCSKPFNLSSKHMIITGYIYQPPIKNLICLTHWEKKSIEIDHNWKVDQLLIGKFWCEFYFRTENAYLLPSGLQFIKNLLITLLKYQVINFLYQLRSVKIEEREDGILQLYLWACCLNRKTAHLLVSFANASADK